MQVQLSHPARTVEVKGPKKVKDLLRELNLVVEAHLVIKGDDLVTEDEMLYDVDQIEVRPVISGGNQAEVEARPSKNLRLTHPQPEPKPAFT